MDLLALRFTLALRSPRAAMLGRLASWCVLVPLAALCGASWSWGKAGAMSPLVMVAWWRSRTRAQAMAVGAAYQLGATWGLARAVALWMEVPPLQGAALLACAAILSGLCWSAVVPASCATWKQAVLALLPWIALTLFPLSGGALIAGHPLIAAGWWCPGAGWVGLLIMLALFVGARTRGGATLMVAWGLVAVVTGAAPKAVPDLGAIDTRSKPSRGELDFLGQYQVVREALDRAKAERAKLVVLPEGAGGTWTDSMRGLWAPYSAQLAHEGRSALVGAALQGETGLANVVIGLGRAEGQLVHQRLPIPGAMWRPWSEEGFVPRPWDAGVLELGGVPTGVLVCWEGALVWPALRSMASGARALVLVANHGWTGPRTETRRGLEAWGLLFGVPVAMAENVWREP